MEGSVDAEEFSCRKRVREFTERRDRTLRKQFKKQRKYIIDALEKADSKDNVCIAIDGGMKQQTRDWFLDNGLIFTTLRDGVYVVIKR
jgi:hypothetical protein